jgi:hypothetical protein
MVMYFMMAAVVIANLIPGAIKGVSLPHLQPATLAVFP